MNIYTHEFKMKLRSVITWSISIVLILIIFMSMFSSMAVDADTLNKMMQNFPKELRMAFGMEDFNWGSVLGFFTLIFLFCQICLAIQASTYGVALVSVEERELTADFLLTKPVKRTQILTSKLLAAVTGLIITNIVVWISSYVVINLFRGGREYELKPLLLLLLSIGMFQFFFLSVGLVISLLVKRVRNVTPYALALAFGLYFLNAFGNMFGKDSLEFLTPYNHFEPNYIIKHAAYNLPMVLISLVVIIFSIAASYVLYIRRNITTPV